MPVVVALPGVLVSVQVPVAGRPVKITLPVARVQVGGVMVPTVGGTGIFGCALITTLAEAPEVQADIPSFTV